MTKEQITELIRLTEESILLFRKITKTSYFSYDKTLFMRKMEKIVENLKQLKADTNGCGEQAAMSILTGSKGKKD